MTLQDELREMAKAVHLYDVGAGVDVVGLCFENDPWGCDDVEAALTRAAAALDARDACVRFVEDFEADSACTSYVRLLKHCAEAGVPNPCIVCRARTALSSLEPQ